MSPAEKKSMIKRDHPQLSIAAQCRPLKLSRSTLHCAPVGIDGETLALLKVIDRVFTKYPFFGSRQIAMYPRREGTVAVRHRVRRLMRLMGLEAAYKRSNTSKPYPAHPIYPYLLRKLSIDRPNQILLSAIANNRLQGSGCADITFIPVRRGFPYLVAIMDWATRKALSWCLSNTLHASFRVEALKEAINK